MTRNNLLENNLYRMKNPTYSERLILLEKSGNDILLKNILSEASVKDYWNRVKAAAKSAKGNISAKSAVKYLINS